MNRLLTVSNAPMSECPVQWRELVPLFKCLFPCTIDDVQTNDIRARVIFCGTPFDIIPECIPGWNPSFSVWGPAHVNKFPDTI